MEGTFRSLKMSKEVIEFNKKFSIHKVMTMCGGIPNTNLQPLFYGNDILYPEYAFMSTDSFYRPAFINLENGSLTIVSPFRVTLRTPSSFDVYKHFGCNNDQNLAMNWHDDFRFKESHPVPLIDINQIIDNNQSNLKELPLLSCIVPSSSFAANFAKHLSDISNIPPGTSLMSLIASFSALTGKRYNCAFEDGETVSISEYVFAQHPSGTNKSRLQNLTISPMKKMIRKRCQTLEAIIEVIEARLDEIRLDVTKKNELGHLNRKLKKLNKQLNFVSNLNPISNATPEALEEVLKHTNGTFTAISSEQALVNSLLFSSGKKSNTDLLLIAREGGDIRSNRVGRIGYSGHCSATIFCFAQENIIPKMIEASDVSGLFERFLIIAEPDRVGQRNHLQAVQPDKNMLELYERKCSFFEKVLDDGFDKDKLITLQISNSDWLNVHHLENEFEAQLNTGGKYSHPIMRRFISKTRLHVMSLACNLFLLNDEAPDQSCYVPSQYVLSAIYMMRHLIDGLHTYCLGFGIISNDEQIKFVFDLLVKHKDGLTLHEIKKKCDGVRPFKDLPSPRRTIQDVVYYLANNKILLTNSDNVFIKNPIVH